MARTAVFDNVEVTGTMRMADMSALDLTGAMKGRAGLATNDVGGTMPLTGGAGSGTGAGGVASVTGGVGGATGPGGASSVIGGAGGATSGAGGAVDLTGGAGAAGNSAGGVSTVVGGAGQGSAAGGAASATGGVGGATGVGGNMSVVGGAGGATSGKAGDALVTGGAGGGGDADGGDAILNGGAKDGTGIDGNVISRAPTFLQKKLAQTMGAAATISDADMLSGLIVGTPTADPSNYTTPTGAALSLLFGTVPVVGDSFELTIINDAATAKVIDLVAGASGMTITGESIIENVTDGVAAGLAASGTFVFVNTAADTWIAYRK